MPAKLPVPRGSRRADRALVLAAVDGRTLVADTGFTTAPRRDAGLDREEIRLVREAPFRLGGALRIEPAHRRVAHDDGREEILEPRVMQVLVALAKADGQILSRGDLISSCWAGVVVSEDALNRVISRVRRLAQGFGEFRIETITKVGYRLTAGAASLGQARAEDRSASICVLPFTNMSDNRQQEYFSDGITEDIITDLSKVASLYVVARTTAFTFKDKNLDASQVASQLRVGHVLEGSVRRASGRVRVTAQLIDGATGGHVWAERYDRDFGDIFALQDEISEAVVAALKLKLAPEDRQAIERRSTTDTKAFELYLLARHLYVAGREGDRRSLEAIVRLSARATEVDPNYAQAWALLALAQTWLHDWFSVEDDGHAAVDRALALSPGLADALAVKARRLMFEQRLDEAFAHIEAAFASEPDSWLAHSSAGRLYYFRRQYAEAIEHLEIATRFGAAAGDAGLLMSSYRAIGDWEGVRRAARTTVARADHALQQDCVNVAAVGCSVGALAALGQTERAIDMIERALLIDPANDPLRYNLACGAVAFLEDADTAFSLLAPAFDTMSAVCVEHAKSDPDLASIRSDPRFTALIAAAEARLAAAGRQEASSRQV